jgi:hypothetical protein
MTDVRVVGLPGSIIWIMECGCNVTELQAGTIGKTLSLTNEKFFS